MTPSHHQTTATPRQRAGRRIAGLGLAAVLGAGLLASCGSSGDEIESPYTVDSPAVVLDAPLRSYNAGTIEGATGATVAALSRVVPGAFYIGPGNQWLPNSDFVTATPARVDDHLEVTYSINPEAIWSDGNPVNCEDFYLTWVAGSEVLTANDGTHPFSDALPRVYGDVRSMQCEPGEKDFTAIFYPDAGDATWREMFGPGTVMPWHIVAAESGVPSIVELIRGEVYAGGPSGVGDGVIPADPLREIATAWARTFTMDPDTIDASKLPSAGPYRVQSFTSERGLVLERNPAYWSQEAYLEEIQIFPAFAEIDEAITNWAAVGYDAAAQGLQFPAAQVTTQISANREQLVLSQRDTLADPAARRAVAACVDTETIATAVSELAHPEGVDDVDAQASATVEEDPTSAASTGAQDLQIDPLPTRFLRPNDRLYDLVAPIGEGHSGADNNRARDELASSPHAGGMTVRIGYFGPDERRAAIVEAIAASCRPVGINIEDVSSPEFVPGRFESYDAMLVGDGSTIGPGGAVSTIALIEAMRTGAGANLNDFSDEQVDDLISRVERAANDAEFVDAMIELETRLWELVPTVPLIMQPRTYVTPTAIVRTDINPTRMSLAWNIDRWQYAPAKDN